MCSSGAEERQILVFGKGDKGKTGEQLLDKAST